MKRIAELFGESQVIAAVRSEEQLRQAVNSPVAAIFLLHGDINVLLDYVDYAKGHNKAVFPHMDLMAGIAGDKAGVEYVAREVAPDGIITTRSNLIKAARKQGLLTIQRLFLVDSTAVETGIHAVLENQPDAVEVMPGILPKVVAKIKDRITQPVIAGGLIEDKEEIEQVLAAGAQAVSVGNPKLWAN
ncbi:glycerol-3-phosphate responsive antiterminator [Zhaonella formicivorans]|uniref:glycerol-3-phosphate responsive antiterminator n=1 Tax=Zhaonella formicivorans TaxID=2528593 RepID=UPI0010D16377|nr:glycerol-3-phosphate responsive antiterminator [Zhaonella formicivorans]